MIGIEPNWTKRDRGRASPKTGKPVAASPSRALGELETVERACWTAKEYVQRASELQREPVELNRS